MAIKVKHEGNVTSRAVAGAIGGQARRNAEDSKALAQMAAQQNMAANRQLNGAHASPVSPGHASAQLTHAPTGAAPGIMHAPSGGVHGRGGGGGGRSGTGAGTGAGDSTRRLKVTGNKFFERPDKESVWDQDSRQWVREYLPGEWEAEAQQRIGDVKNAQQMELAEHKAGLERQEYEYRLSTQQKSEIAKINNALDEARRSGRFSDDELAELERQADAKRMGIQPLPTPKGKTPEPVVKMIEGQPFVLNGNKWDPVRQPRPEKSLTLNDVLRNVPTKKSNPNDPNGLDMDIPIDERLDMAQRILDRINGARSPTPEAQPYPLTQMFQNYMFGPQYPGAPLRTDQPAATTPQEPSEAEKKWSAFKGR